MAKNITLMNNDGTEILYPKGQLTKVDFSTMLFMFTFPTAEQEKTFTIPQDAFIFYASETWRYFYLNEINLSSIISSSYTTSLIPVKKGDVIRAKSPWSPREVKGFGIRY